METIGQRLRRLRRARHPPMTQAELAKLCKITPQTVSNLERGIASSTTFLVTLAAALDVSPHYLENGDAVAEAQPAYLTDKIAIDRLIESGRLPAHQVHALRTLAENLADCA
jgi:transcriptional regulator with XRE-family HTH domain